jgi:hypothetical protein
LLDVKSVTKSGERNSTWRIDTWQRWNRYDLWDQGYLAVYLNTFGNKRADYYALIYSNGDEIRGTVFYDRQYKSDLRVRNVRISRPTAKSVNVTVPLDRLRIGKTRRRYTWYVRTTWSGHNCTKVCFDLAPNRARDGDGVSEPLPK